MQARSLNYTEIQRRGETHLGVEHAGQAHQEHLEHAGLEQCDLVILREQGEAWDALRELHNAADGRGKSLREVL